MPRERFTLVPLALFRDPNIKAEVGWTYAALATFARRDRIARPSWETLAELRQVDRATIARHLAILVKCGYVERLAVRRGGRAGQQYRLIHILPVETR